jgi:2-dehydro-3-deoxyglucarate aldolase/4-hydroxy-2-oxoheptanedioate aldolase
MQAGKKVFGQLIGPGNNPLETVKALKDFGYDFIAVDLEHSLVGKDTVYAYVRSAREMGLPILIRPEENTANFRCYLDNGVNGLILPHVSTLKQAKYAVNRAYLPPIGHRGSGIGTSPYLYDFQNIAEVPYLAITEYINDNTMVFPQTESLKGVDDLPHILRLDGITGTIVGCVDLALDIGRIDPRALKAGVINTKAMEKRLMQVVKKCNEAGKVAGIGSFPPKDLAKWAKEGYQLFLLGYVTDGNVGMLQPLLEEAKSLIG